MERLEERLIRLEEKLDEIGIALAKITEMLVRMEDPTGVVPLTPDGEW